MNQIALRESDFERIGYLTREDQVRLYEHLLDRLKPTRLNTPNANVLSTRLPVEVVQRVNQIALRFGTVRSHVLREAILDFCRRHPA